MNVEIRGAGFVNKGAELMLLAVMQEIQKNFNDINFVIEPDLSSQTYSKFSRLGFFQKVWLYQKGIQWGYCGSIIPAKLRKMYGMVLDSEINVILDASGFRYSDQWGTRPTELSAKYVKKWKKQGTKVIFLPQAFGPFKSKKIKDAMKMIVENADMIYARDKISYEHIIEAAGKADNVHLSPDFTNLIDGRVPEWFSKDNHEVCVIPNARMLDKTDTSVAKSYISFLTNCVNAVISNGKKPFLLIHEGEKDLQIAKDINSTLKKELPVIKESDALKIKGIIGASDAVISSRFHGLISALSQGVPALGTGWSHKYQMLFDDYNFSEGLLKIDEGQSIVEEKISMLCDDEKRKALTETLLKSSQDQKEKVKDMWSEIINIVKI